MSFALIHVASLNWWHNSFIFASKSVIIPSCRYYNLVAEAAYWIATKASWFNIIIMVHYLLPCHLQPIRSRKHVITIEECRTLWGEPDRVFVCLLCIVTKSTYMSFNRIVCMNYALSHCSDWSVTVLVLSCHYALSCFSTRL